MGKRFMFGILTALILGGASLFPAATLVSASVMPGQVVEIEAMNSLNATADNQARKGAGRTLAYVLGGAGCCGLATGWYMSGFTGIGSGITLGFVPGMMSSAFDAAPAATAGLVHPGVIDAWWAPATALLYPPLLGLKFLQDPTFWMALITIVLVARLVRTEEAPVVRRG